MSKDGANMNGYAELFNERSHNAFYSGAEAAGKAARGVIVGVKEALSKALGIDPSLLGLGPVVTKYEKTLDGIDFGAASALSTMRQPVRKRALDNLSKGGFNVEKLAEMILSPLVKMTGKALESADNLARGAVSKTREFVGEIMTLAGIDESFDITNVSRKTLGVVLATTIALAVMMAGEAKGQALDVLSLNEAAASTHSVELEGIQGMNTTGYAKFAETAGKAFGPLVEHMFGEPASAEPLGKGTVKPSFYDTADNGSFYDAPDSKDSHSFYDSDTNATLDAERAEMLEMALAAARRFIEENRNGKREAFEASLDNMSNRVFVDNVERTAADLFAVKYDEMSRNKELLAALYVLCETDDKAALTAMDKFGISADAVAHLVMEDRDLGRAIGMIRGLSPEQAADTVSFIAGEKTNYAKDAGQEGPWM